MAVGLMRSASGFEDGATDAVLGATDAVLGANAGALDAAMGVALDDAAGAASGVAAGAACGATGAANGAVAGAVLLLLGFCSTRLAEAEGSAVAEENRSLCFFSAGSCEVGTREADASKYWLAADSTEP